MININDNPRHINYLILKTTRQESLDKVSSSFCQDILRMFGFSYLTKNIAEY